LQNNLFQTGAVANGDDISFGGGSDQWFAVREVVPEGGDGNNGEDLHFDLSQTFSQASIDHNSILPETRLALKKTRLEMTSAQIDEAHSSQQNDDTPLGKTVGCKRPHDGDNCGDDPKQSRVAEPRAVDVPSTSVVDDEAALHAALVSRFKQVCPPLSSSTPATLFPQAIQALKTKPNGYHWVTAATIYEGLEPTSNAKAQQVSREFILPLVVLMELNRGFTPIYRWAIVQNKAKGNCCFEAVLSHCKLMGIKVPTSCNTHAKLRSAACLSLQENPFTSIGNQTAIEFFVDTESCGGNFDEDSIPKKGEGVTLPQHQVCMDAFKVFASTMIEVGDFVSTMVLCGVANVLNVAIHVIALVPLSSTTAEHVVYNILPIQSEDKADTLQVIRIMFCGGDHFVATMDLDAVEKKLMG